MMFLRDLFVKNRAFTEASLDGLYTALEDAKRCLAQSLISADESSEKVHLSIVIRFDNHGYRVFSIAELKRYFNNAHDIERVSFEIETTTSLRTSRNWGAHCVLQLDSRDPNRCILQVAADDKSWVEQTFAEVSALIDKRKTVSRFVRTPVTQLVIQVSGVVLGVLACLWVARRVAPALAIESPFLIAFLVALLIFSNIWGYLYRWIGATIDKAFPNVMFLRADEERHQWLLQGIVLVPIGAAVAKVGFVLWGLIAYAAKEVLK